MHYGGIVKLNRGIVNVKIAVVIVDGGIVNVEIAVVNVDGGDLNVFWVEFQR